MPADGSPNSVFNWDVHHDNVIRQEVDMRAAQVPPPHQELQGPNREFQLRHNFRRAEAEPLLHDRPEEPEPQPHLRPVPQAVWPLNWNRTRSGYRKVMGKSGSRRRMAAKVGVVGGVAAAAVVAGATVAGGILVVIL